MMVALRWKQRPGGGIWCEGGWIVLKRPAGGYTMLRQGRWIGSAMSLREAKRIAQEFEDNQA